MKTMFPTAKIFTLGWVFTGNANLVLYKTSDIGTQNLALHFNNGQWEISELQSTTGRIDFTTKKIARSNEIQQLQVATLCPTEVHTWQYWDDASSSWVDAGPRIQLTGSTCKFFRFYFFIGWTYIRVYLDQRCGHWVLFICVKFHQA